MATPKDTEFGNNKLGETAIESAKQIAEINIRTGDKLLQQQVELAESFLNAATRSVDLAVKAKGYQDALNGQAQIAQEYVQNVVTSYRRATEILSEAGKSYAAVADQAAKKARVNVAPAA